MARFLPFLLPLPFKPATLVSLSLRHTLCMARCVPALFLSLPLSIRFSLFSVVVRRQSVRVVFLPLSLFTSSFTFRPYFPRCFALSSVMFIECDVTMRSPTTRLRDAPRSSGPAGRPSQSECLISYFWFSYFVAALFLLLLFLIFCPNRPFLPVAPTSPFPSSSLLSSLSLF